MRSVQLGLILSLWCVATSSSLAADVTPRLMVQSAPGGVVGGIGGSLVVSPDSKLVASTSPVGKSVQIWQAQTGRLLCNLDRAALGNSSAAGEGAAAIAFSADSLKLATAADAGALALWDLRSCAQSARLDLEPRQQQSAKALATIADGRVLILAGDSRLYIVDVFRGKALLEPVMAGDKRASRLIGLSEDGRYILEGQLAGDSKGPRNTLTVLDRERGTTDALSEFAGAQATNSAAIAGLFKTAAISRTGRWIVAYSGGKLALYDREGKRVVASADLDSDGTRAAAKRTATPTPNAPQPGQKPKTLPDMMQEEQRKQLENIDEMLKMLPLAQREAARKSLEKALGEGMSKAQQEKPENVPEDPSAAASDLMQSVLHGPHWLGFSNDDERVYLWRNTAALEPTANTATPPLVFEVRRRSDLSLIKGYNFSENLSANGADTLLAGSFGQSADRKRLALQIGAIGGAKMAIVDLAAEEPHLRTWSPSSGLAVAVAWTEASQLVTVNTLQTQNNGLALAARSAVPSSGTQPPAPLPSIPGLGSGALSANMSFASRIVRWDLATGDVVDRHSEDRAASDRSINISYNGKYAVRAKLDISSPETASLQLSVEELGSFQQLWKGPTVDSTGKPIRSQPYGTAVSSNGKLIALLLGGTSGVLIVEVGSGRVVAEHRLPPSARARFTHRGFGFTPDDQAVVVPAGRDLYVVDVHARKASALRRFAFEDEFYGVIGANPLRAIVAGGSRSERSSERNRNRRAREAENDQEIAPEGQSLATVALKPLRERIAVANFTGTLVAATAADNRIELYRPSEGETPSVQATLAGHTARVTAVAFAPNDKHLASTSEDGATFIWDVASGQWIAKLYTFPDGTWAVVDPTGRFDTNNLEEVEQLHWVVSDDPLRALPLEVFMRDYYEPRLLPKLMAGAKLPALRNIAELNRAQPEIAIVQIEQDAKDPARVAVTLEVKASKDAKGESGGVYDVRLFRDGRLVAMNPMAEGAVKLDPATSSARLRFGSIRLPSTRQPLRFSAYAFNRDRVKSATVHATYTAGAATRAPRRAYILTIGVNAHESPVWNLDFAANDARRMREVLSARIASTKDYEETIGIELVSESGGTDNATKDRISSAIALLAGKAANVAALQGVANAEKLKPATPDDIVIIAFSGHGLAGQGGAFYLLPSDIGKSSERTLTDELRRRSISTDDLTAWLREIDAGDVVMIVDACHSAASVEAEGFKPGPMGSKGLGQLAYDKGVRILAASQADDVAMESGKLRHGLLTYALVNDGIEASLADFRPTDKRIELAEWLGYGVQRVPQLHSEVRVPDQPERGASRPASRRAGPAVQQPKLFDFSRVKAQPVVAVLN